MSLSSPATLVTSSSYTTLSSSSSSSLARRHKRVRFSPAVVRVAPTVHASTRTTASPSSSPTSSPRGRLSSPRTLTSTSSSSSSSLLWYSREDCLRFTDEFHRDIEEMRSTAAGYGKQLAALLEECQALTNRHDDNDKKDDDDDSASFLELPRSLQRVNLTPSRFVGLERYAARTIFENRKFRRYEQWEAVCDIQDAGLRGSRLEALLQQSCQRISRPSALFAQVVAHAVRKVNLPQGRPTLQRQAQRLHVRRELVEI